MITAARLAGAGLMRHFRERDRLVIEEKGPADFVSTADLESQTSLFGALSAAFPGYGFLGEEKLGHGGDLPSEARFVVDPLDGTMNFLAGIPHFAVSIALERAGRVVAGLVYDPPKEEMFVAELGRGAHLVTSDSGSAARLRVSSAQGLSASIVGTGVPHAGSRVRHASYLPRLASVMGKVAGVRRMAAAALDLSYVAAGRFTAFFEYSLKRWDIAAGALLVQEAGGRVSEPGGGQGHLESGDVLATNGRLHEPMQRLLDGPRGGSRLLRARRSTRR